MPSEEETGVDHGARSGLPRHRALGAAGLDREDDRPPQGTSSVLPADDIQKPTPGDDEVLLRVAAASIHIAAGGGVGDFAVPMAKALGAHVTGVCSAEARRRALGPPRRQTSSICALGARDARSAPSSTRATLSRGGMHRVKQHLAGGRVIITMPPRSRPRRQLSGGRVQHDLGPAIHSLVELVERVRRLIERQFVRHDAAGRGVAVDDQVA
jgi:hypothetical protein